MELSKMNIEETSELLLYWENTIDGCKWTEEDRQLTIDVITQSSLTLKEWKEWLVKVPNQVEERYRKAMKLLVNDRLITEAAYQTELEVMSTFSPALLTKRGKEWMEWRRLEQQRVA